MPSEDDDDWEVRAMQATVHNFTKPNTEQHRCIVCHEEPVADPCEAEPCHHRLGCWECVTKVMYRFGRCSLCRVRICSLKRDSTGEVIFNYGDGPGFEEGDDDELFDDEQDDEADPGGPDGGLHFDLSGVYLANWDEWLASLRRHNVNTDRLERRRPRPTNPDGLDRAVARRRSIYFHYRFSHHVGSNRWNGWREVTPQRFRDDPDLVSRARMWMRREFLVFSFIQFQNGTYETETLDLPSNSLLLGRNTNPQDRTNTRAARRRAQNAEFLLEYIIAILKSVDIVGHSGIAHTMVSEYLGWHDASLFLHELRSWLRSPYTRLEDWDRAVQYDGEIRPAWLGPPLGDREPGESSQARERQQSPPVANFVRANTRLNRSRNSNPSDRYRDRYRRKESLPAAGGESSQRRGRARHPGDRRRG